MRRQQSVHRREEHAGRPDCSPSILYRDIRFIGPVGSGVPREMIAGDPGGERLPRSVPGSSERVRPGPGLPRGRRESGRGQARYERRGPVAVVTVDRLERPDAVDRTIAEGLLDGRTRFGDGDAAVGS